MKCWNLRFSSDRGVEECNPWIASRQARNEDEDDDELGFLLEDSEELGPSRHVEEVKQFCRDTWLDNFESEPRTTHRRQAAWLDDRTSFPRSKEGVRIYQNPLSPGSLYQQLRASVSATYDRYIAIDSRSTG